MTNPLATPRAAGYRLPAEWEKQRAVWLAWPHEQSDYPGKLEAVRWVYCEIIACLSRAVSVELVVQDAEARAQAEAQIQVSGSSLKRINFRILPTDRAWTRDYLPTWLVGNSEGHSPLAAVKWLFNGWARYDNYFNDDAAGLEICKQVAERYWLPARPSRGTAATGAKSRFVLEGGAIDSDGQGTLLTTTHCLLGVECPRNPGLSRTDIEGVLRDYLGAEQVIWLPGDVAGDDTSGHVDDVARFVAPGTVVVPVEPNAADPNHRALAEARRVLLEARDARGRLLQVVDLPMPAPRFYDGERLPATYANFLITNDWVLVPTFNDPQDRVALGVLGELFPERQVVGIHSADLVLGLGAIHCSTNHEPLPLG